MTRPGWPWSRWPVAALVAVGPALGAASCGVPEVAFFADEAGGGAEAGVVDASADATVPDATTPDVAVDDAPAVDANDGTATPVDDGAADAPTRDVTSSADAPIASLLCVDGGPAPGNGVCCGDVPCFGCTKCNKCTKACNEGQACCMQDGGAIACIAVTAPCE